MSEVILVNSLRYRDEVQILPHGSAIWRVVVEPFFIRIAEYEGGPCDFWRVEMQSVKATQSGKAFRPVTWAFEPSRKFKLIRPSPLRS